MRIVREDRVSVSPFLTVILANPFCLQVRVRLPFGATFSVTRGVKLAIELALDTVSMVLPVTCLF